MNVAEINSDTKVHHTYRKHVSSPTVFFILWWSDHFHLDIVVFAI